MLNGGPKNVVLEIYAKNKSDRKKNNKQRLNTRKHNKKKNDDY